MYQAKASGRNALCFFEASMQAVVTRRAELEAELRLGLAREEMLVYYQPVVSVSGSIVGVEALVRWQHPLRGLVAPAEFIALAEQTGLIVPLGAWVMETVGRQLVHWAKQPATQGLSIAVNVSARQFRQAGFVTQVRDMLQRTGANPRLLKLELTESMLLSDVEAVIGIMTHLKTLGVSFSLDDFGTGYSSLAYLKRLPLDQLKIDKSFVRDVLTNPDDAAIARAILTLALSLDLDVVAEGIEELAQRDLFVVWGCHSFQGYYFGHPVPEVQLGFSNS
jgi:EAL domain-containing protein (putative c-di-GMP-specific phosphodiesterase class I)